MPASTSTSLLTDMYELTMLDAALKDGTAHRRCTFELFGRRLPATRRFGVVAGTGRILEALERFGTIGIKMRGADFHTITRSVSLVAPTDTGRDIARAARELFAREDMPIGGVRLFGVRVEGLQARSGGVAVTLDRDERPAASERAMDQIRTKFGAGALAPATLLGKKTPERRSFGADDRQASSAEVSSDRRSPGTDGPGVGGGEPQQGTLL